MNIFYKETSGLHEAAFLLAGFALLSKVLALVRDRFLADQFGASLELDIYYAAFRIPDFIYVSLASLVAAAVLIPFITEHMKHGRVHALSFFSSVFTTFLVSMTAVSALAFFTMPYLSPIIAPGLSESAHTDITFLSRIMLASPILLGLSGLFASVTQTLKRFLVYAIAPVLYNVGIIAGVVFFYPLLGLSGLAYGVVLGALLHMVIQVPVLARARFLPRFVPRVKWSSIKNVVFLSLPRTLTLSAHHVTLLVLIALASFMAEGSIAIFNLSFNLQSVPLSIIGLSYSIAAFPTLSRYFADGDTRAFVAQILTATRHIIFWSLPIVALFVVLRAQIVRTVLGTGNFDWADTRLTAAVLALFVISVAAQSLILLFVRGYYAAGYTKKPFVVNVASLAVVVVSAFLLIWMFTKSQAFQFFMESLFRIEGVHGSEIMMLPLAFSLGMILNGIILWRLFLKDFMVDAGQVRETFRHSLYAAVIMGFTAHQFLKVFDDVFDINTFAGIFFQGLFSGVLGIAAGIFLLKLMKNAEIKVVQKTLTQKFWRTRPVAPDQEEL